MATKFDKIKDVQLKGGLLDTDNVPGQMSMPEDYPETAPEPKPEAVKKSSAKKKEHEGHKLASFYLSAEDLDLYRRYATATGVTMSKLVGMAVKEYVNNGVKTMTNKERTIFNALKK